MLNDFCDHYATTYHHYKGGSWCYEDGLIYRGLAMLHEASGEQRWMDHLLRLLQQQVLVDSETGSLALRGHDPNDYNIDNILPGRALLYLDRVTDDPRYLQLAGLLMDQLKTHPRTHSGVYWHKLRYPWQIWLDGLYMGAPFQIAYAQATGQDELIADSLRQLDTALSVLHVPATGLYAHAVDEARKQAWADPETGRSPDVHWGRALGWLAMALVDVASLVGDTAFQPLRERTVDLLHRIATLRQPEGLWLQVVNQPRLEGNYTESSASAMFAYALLQGARLGLCTPPDADLLAVLVDTTLQADADGEYAMIDICEVAGLGRYEDRFRDGSAAYYLSERRVANDAKGVGPLMMCHALAL